MAAALPALNLANLLSLPARHFAVVDSGPEQTRLLVAAVARGRPRILTTRIVDAVVEGFTTPEEMREEVRQHLRDLAPEALVLVLPQHRILRHVLDVPPGADSAQTRALVEREASNIGGLSESQWAFDSIRLRPFARLANPLAAAFCRQDQLQELIDDCAEDERLVFDIRPAGDALAAAFRSAGSPLRHAILADVGPRHTALTILADGQAVFSSSFPFDLSGLGSGSPKSPTPADWQAEFERTVLEWREDVPDLGPAAASWPALLAGSGPLVANLLEALRRDGPRRFEPWPPGPAGADATPDFASCWGALLLALGLAGPAPSLLPAARRSHWAEQRLWRTLLTANLTLAALLLLALGAATWNQRQILADKAAWKQEATRALRDARDIRLVSEGLNTRMDGLRPVVERQRQTIETLQLLSVLQRQRTNTEHWYVLLADAASYAAGSNNFGALPLRPPETRPPPPPGTATLLTNPPAAPSRAFIAEVCLVPQGERMRQALSDLVGELKRFALFRNVDVLPAERRRDLVATNLIFPERHFALELNLSEAELLPAIPLPRPVVTNREPRSTFRTPIRTDAVAPTNSGRNGRPR